VTKKKEKNLIEYLEKLIKASRLDKVLIKSGLVRKKEKNV
tara:strand:+ start:418 stop:537 length:120 start_codon:yes stop_codon:yes gene_type:complete